MTALLLLLGLLLASPAGAQEGVLRPVDEAVGDCALLRFRAGLRNAVARRDTAYVLRVLTPDVVTGFGSEGTVEGFRRMWLGEPRGRDLWSVLDEVLRLGGGFRNDSTFAAPYTYAAFPDSLDAYRHGVVTGTGVRVRSEPRVGAPVLGSLSHAIVRVPSWEPRADEGGGALRWLPVTLEGGARGYIAQPYLRSPLDYRAVLVRREGAWRLRALVAGD